MADQEYEGRELSRAIETIRATTRAGRAVKQHQADIVNQGGHRGGNRGRNRCGNRGGNQGGKA
jgi:hypothetical protein